MQPVRESSHCSLERFSKVGRAVLKANMSMKAAWVSSRVELAADDERRSSRQG